MNGDQNKNLGLASDSVARRPFNPRSKHLMKTLSMIETTNSEFEPQRQIPIIDIRPVSNFNTKDEYVEAMVEDLCDWFNFLYNLENEDQIKPSTFFLQLEDGVILNKHAAVVQLLAESFLKSEKMISRTLPLKIGNQAMRVPDQCPKYVNVDFTKKINSFHKRDNVSNFIQWSRDFNIPPSLTFETNDLILLNNPRNVVVCLLEIARIGGFFGIEVPDIIQLDQEINEEIISGTASHTTREKTNQADNFKIPVAFSDTNVTIRKKSRLPRKSSMELDFRNSKTNQIRQATSAFDNIDNALPDFESSHYFDYRSLKSNSMNLKVDNSDNESINSHGSQYLIPKYKTQKPVGRVKIYDCFDKGNFVREKKYREKCDMRSLDERVRDVLSECQCCETFPMKRISEGKYQWGDKKTLIFVRILRNHVMVRVGGGWDTLNEFLNKHDLCRKEKTNTQKSIPQIRKPLQPSVPSCCDLKSSHQGASIQNGNLGDFRRNGFIMNLNRKDNNVNAGSISLSDAQSLSFPSPHQIESKSSNVIQHTIKSDNKENSSQPPPPETVHNVNEDRISECTIITQSNQKNSRIPILKKR